MLRLTKPQIEEFYGAGYVVLPDVFGDAELREIGAAFDRMRDIALKLTEPQMVNGSYFVVKDHKINRIVWCGAAEPVLLKYGADERLTFPSSQLLGSEEMDQLICQAHYKLPADGVSFDWHQDSDHRRYGTDVWTDVNGRGSFVQTLMAVDEMNEENGPLLVVPGSGRKGHQYLKEHHSPLDEVFDGRSVPLTMGPGSVLFLGPYTVHGSKPNRSKQARRIFINGYAYPGANRRVYPGEGAGRRLKSETAAVAR
jgi:ectoine hydroxylase-related dioxygenase (phytanoyl-CoA dioxygenase family)